MLLIGSKNLEDLGYKKNYKLYFWIHDNTKQFVENTILYFSNCFSNLIPQY